jgi:hypothetical protein
MKQTINFKTTLTKADGTFTHLGTAIYDGKGSFSIQLEGSKYPFNFGETTENDKIEEINFHMGYVLFGEYYNDTLLGTFKQSESIVLFNTKFGNPKWETEVISK